MVKQMSLNELLENRVKHVEEVIYKYMPENEGLQISLIEAMAYSVRAGGKRLRPLILEETYKACGGKDSLCEPFMAALEMIHTYSLVHDDLPAMDNDTLRRGNDTTWVKYGEAMAVLAGDGLLNYAYETAVKSFDMTGDAPQKTACVVKALRILTKRAGIYGMVGGQGVDVESEKKHIALDNDKLIFIHENKTGALIQAAFECGAYLAGASEEMVQKLSRAALCFGVAFQIQDDILDVIGDEKLLGKNIGSDEASGKETYVTLFGMDEAVKAQQELSKEAVAILEENLKGDNFLAQLVKAMTERKY